MSIWKAFSASWAAPGDILPDRMASKTHSKRFQKLIEIFVILGPPPGEACDNRRPGSPSSKKRTFSPKTAISLQRGANFQFLDFGTPLEKSISLTFSEQWLCHFSKEVFRWGVPVGRPCERQPHANFVHGGTVADIYIYTHIYIERERRERER